MKFVSMLDEELLFENIPGSSRAAVYTAMLEKLAASAELTLDIPAVVQEMVEREQSAGIVFPGVALPHVRIDGLHDLFIAVGIPESAEAMGTEHPADVIFMILIGEDMSDVYLKMIAALARHMASGEAVNALRSAARKGKNALWKYFLNNDIRTRQVVTAEDIMSPADVFIHEDAPLSDAFDLFCSQHRKFLPVVNAQNQLVGELSAVAVIKSFFPEYVFMMDNLNFLNNFAVFNEIFHAEHTLPVSRYMSNAPCSASLETPLVQLTLQLTKKGAGNIYIVDEGNKLKGIFSIDNVISKVLRG